MKVIMVACLTIIPHSWGKTFLIETKDEGSPYPYHKTEAGDDYNDEDELGEAETLICEHFEKGTLEKFEKLPEDEKREIVEEMNKVIVNARNQKERRHFPTGESIKVKFSLVVIERSSFFHFIIRRYFGNSRNYQTHKYDLKGLSNILKTFNMLNMLAPRPLIH